MESLSHRFLLAYVTIATLGVHRSAVFLTVDHSYPPAIKSTRAYSMQDSFQIGLSPF